MRNPARKRRSETNRPGAGHWKRLSILGMCIAISGCETKRVAPTEEKASSIVSSDIVGSWTLSDMNGSDHPMVGGTMEFSGNGEIISYHPSGEKEEGKSATFWYLFHLESGEAVIATDTRFSPSGDSASALERLEMPMVVVLEGDTMSWNLLEREPGQRAKPSGKTAYRFTRKSPK